MRSLRLLYAGCLVVPMLAGLAAPVRAFAQDSTQKVAEQPKIKRRANLISEEEIAALGGQLQTALGIVQRLRPAMLRPRGGNSSSQGSGSPSMDAMNEIQVYLDNQRLSGGLAALADVTLAQIKEIRSLTASDATTLFGTNNPAGAIQIIGKR